jgi:uncharacterized membrane protein YgaE (UPF0421/DUF939 family)
LQKGKKTKENKLFWSFRSGIRYALLALLTVFGARFFTLFVLETSKYAPMGALWAMISGMVVMTDTCSSTIDKARYQVLGGLIGAIAGFIYLSFFPFSFAGIVIMIGIVAAVCQATQLSGYIPGAAMNTGVILIFSSLNPELTPLMNSSLRLIEMGIGCGFAILVVRFFPGTTDPAA